MFLLFEILWSFEAISTKSKNIFILRKLFYGEGQDSYGLFFVDSSPYDHIHPLVYKYEERAIPRTFARAVSRPLRKFVHAGVNMTRARWQRVEASV